MNPPSEVHVIDMTAPDARPGYRVSPAELSNEQAWQAMNDVCVHITEKALEMRLDLLRLGFSSEHSMCKQLDVVARTFSDNREVVLRDWAASRTAEPS